MSMLHNDDDLDGAPPPRQFERIGMWDQERESPGLYALLYAAAMLAGLLGHHVIGWLVQLFGQPGQP
jgi:hypothetical protein